MKKSGCHLTIRDSVAEMEQHTASSVHLRAGRGQFALLKRSSCLKFLGISLVAHQLPTASAESICSAFNSLGKRFDLIGLISAFGTAAATKSVAYSALSDHWLYVTGHVGPGGLNVAAALFQATGFRLGRLLAFGGMAEDSNNPGKLEPTGGLHYIGLKSSTDCPVGNAVGEAIVQEHESLWTQGYENDSEDGRRRKCQESVGRQANRSCKVVVLSVEEDPSNRVIFVSLKANKWSALLYGWLPLALTIAVIVSCCFCKLWVVAGLILFGTLGMMLAVLGLRHFCHFKYSQPQVAGSSPEGDILVVDDKEPDVLHVVKANEATVQKLFQRKIVFQAVTGRYILFLAASMLYIYVLVSVLYMSNVQTSGQIHFAIATLIGLVADMAKASQNGKLGLAKKACEKFRIVQRREIVFGNRTAAVAFVAAHANDRGLLKSKKLLPCDGPTWESWWETLAASAPPKTAAAAAADANVQNGPDRLLNTLLRDLNDGLGEF